MKSGGFEAPLKSRATMPSFDQCLTSSRDRRLTNVWLAIPIAVWPVFDRLTRQPFDQYLTVGTSVWPAVPTSVWPVFWPVDSAAVWSLFDQTGSIGRRLISKVGRRLAWFRPPFDQILTVVWPILTAVWPFFFAVWPFLTAVRAGGGADDDACHLLPVLRHSGCRSLLCIYCMYIVCILYPMYIICILYVYYIQWCLQYR